MLFWKSAGACAGVLLSVAASGSAYGSVNCRNTGNFDRWMQDFRREAASSGVTQRTITSALDGITLDETVISRDRKQGFFAQSFLDFVGKLATPNRVQSGTANMGKHRPLFNKVEEEYGVPPAVITAFWALESDFGSGMGKLSVLRSLATLAYDCRRGDMFRVELMEALRIIDHGDLRPSDMIGSWAGELGQTQFLPSHYNKYAVDYDGDGRRDLMRSTPDIIASSAKFIVALGWQRGQPWLEEVSVPERLDWAQADLAVEHPRSKWASWGVRRIDGQPLPNDNMPASLLLLMGRDGPAFLAYQNFRVFTEWNKSLNYATTAAYLATRLSGAQPMTKGRRLVPVLDQNAMRELQQLLARQGHDVGEIDGRLGSATRKAVKAMQIKFALPADSYPTAELIQRLRQGR